MKDIAKLYEELRSIIDGGSESFTHDAAVQYLKDKLVQRTRVGLTLAEFEAEFSANVVYEGIYDDSAGRRIVVIRMLELYALMNELMEKNNA